MANKLLILKGSPREKGNSAVLADQAAAGARAAGWQVEATAANVAAGSQSFGLELQATEATMNVGTTLRRSATLASNTAVTHLEFRHNVQVTGAAAAALMGQGWSLWRDERRRRHAAANREPVVRKRRRKTVAGTLGCFAVSMLMILLVMGPRPVIVILGGLGAALMERWTPGRWDNLTLPLATAGIVQIVQAWLS